jgi:hypothetical protein
LTQHQRSGFGDGFFHRENTDEVVSDVQMIPFGLNIGVGNLKVQELSILRAAVNAPPVVVQQATENAETVVRLQSFNLHKIRKLVNE